MRNQTESGPRVVDRIAKPTHISDALKGSQTDAHAHAELRSKLTVRNLGRMRAFVVHDPMFRADDMQWKYKIRDEVPRNIPVYLSTDTIHAAINTDNQASSP